jgi:hypothetical protein
MYAGYILKEELSSECHLQSVVPTGQSVLSHVTFVIWTKGACEKVVYMQKQKPHLCT